ncbi:MAG: hypothetical protein ACFFG0_03605 [Candidatus Thorarchaeota archaeon]
MKKLILALLCGIYVLSSSVYAEMTLQEIEKEVKEYNSELQKVQFQHNQLERSIYAYRGILEHLEKKKQNILKKQKKVKTVEKDDETSKREFKTNEQ